MNPRNNSLGPNRLTIRGIMLACIGLIFGSDLINNNAIDANRQNNLQVFL